MNARTRLASILVIAFLVQSVFASSALAQCVEFARLGLFDTTHRVSDYQFYSVFARTLRTQEYSTYSSAKSFGANAGIPIDGFLIEFGLKANEQGYQQFQHLSEDRILKTISVNQLNDSYTHTISPAMVDLLKSCQAAFGVHQWSEFGGNNILVVHDLLLAPHGVRVSTITAKPVGNGVRCKPSERRVENGQDKIITCTRTSASEHSWGVITVESTATTANGGGAFVAWLPPVPVAQPEACTVEELLTVPGKAHVLTWTGMGDKATDANAVIDGGIDDAHAWNRMDSGDAEIRIDLGSPAHVTRVQIVINQSPSGPGHHQVVGESINGGSDIVLADFQKGKMSDYETFESAVPQGNNPLVEYVKWRMFNSPVGSFSALREVRVYGCRAIH